MNRVLVSGGAGYLGRVLINRLLEEKFSVRVLDVLLYKNYLPKNILSNIEFINGDIRDLALLKKSLKGIENVIHLASLVGDTICANHPQAAYEINTQATKNFAKLSAGKVKNFIFSSTCSVYGYNLKAVDENSSLNPISLYAWTKVEAEKAILNQKINGLKPTIFRLSTLYGLSPRMRFDLVINRFCAQAFCDKKITLWAGKQWRPFIHIEDAADAYIHVMKNDKKRKNVIYNLGSTKQNAQIYKVAKLIAEVIPKTKIALEPVNADNRSYKVEAKRLISDLKFIPQKTLTEGIQEIYDFLTSNKSLNYKSPKYRNFSTRIKMYTLNTNWQRKYFSGLAG